MFRTILIAAFLFFMVNASAQSTNMSKAAISNTENSIVEIIEPAIPFDRLHEVEIDPANYHKAVTLGDSTNASSPGQEVNITTAAVKYGNGAFVTNKKEVQNSEVPGSSQGKQKMVEVSAPATRRK